MRRMKVIALVATAGTLLQVGSCNDFLIRFAGLGAIVSGLSNLLRGA